MNAADAAIERKSGEGGFRHPTGGCLKSDKKKPSGKSAKSEEGRFRGATDAPLKSDKKEEQQ